MEILKSGRAIPDLDRLIFEHALDQTRIGIEAEPAGQGRPLDVGFHHEHSAVRKVLGKRLCQPETHRRLPLSADRTADTQDGYVSYARAPIDPSEQLGYS